MQVITRSWVVSLRSVTFSALLTPQAVIMLPDLVIFFCSSNSSGSNNVSRSYIQARDTLLGIKVKNEIYSQIRKKKIKRRDAEKD